MERLDDGEVIIGDGSYIKTLEQRGYVLACDWTPEVVVKHPDAVRELGKEFARAGADITQTCTYYASATNMCCNDDGEIERRRGASCTEINQKACEIANELSEKYGTITAGSVAQTQAYFQGSRDKQEIRKELAEALKVLIDNDVDFILLEYFGHIEEMEWAVELALEYGKPVAACMCIGPKGDRVRVSALECARRLAATGADIIGINCLFDPVLSLKTMEYFKQAVDQMEAKKVPHLMVQPIGYHTQDVGLTGWLNTEEFPFAVEPRHITRWEAARYARDAYNLGIRYIGGCCGFESYHVRAMAEELIKERGNKWPTASNESDIDLKLNLQRAKDQGFSTKKWSKNYWMNLAAPKNGRIPKDSF